MCGIFAIFSRTGKRIESKQYKANKTIQSLRELAFQQSRIQRHRGPDDTGIELIDDDGVVMVHERLEIISLKTGHQPFKSETGDIVLIANAEIYNYLELSAEIAKKLGGYKPKSDCNVIIELYQEYGIKLFNYITGMFAFVLYDKKNKTLLVARDPTGIITLYHGVDEDNNIWIASEMKSLIGSCKNIEQFPPGHMMYGNITESVEITQYYKPNWMYDIPKELVNLTCLRQKLESAVRSHLQCDVNFGALLSGGVDSSLIASIATKILREKDPKYRLKTYSVGLPGAPDFKYSRMVANYIDSDHTEIIFKVEDGLDYIRDIIYHLESYDVTTVRCSIPMFIMLRYIKSENIKVILSGEGADEIFGGYLYFFQAPTHEEFHTETVTRVQRLHLSDCLRANKVSMAWSVELRVPFLDTAFIDYSMSVRPEDKIPGDKNCYMDKKQSRMEKFILRNAFTNNYLPDEVLWRQKEQFSDGVGYSWIDTIKEHASSHVTDEMYMTREQLYPINTPTTKEAFYYRQIFEELFPGQDAAKTIKKWVPRLDWGCAEDPSGRAQTIHQQHK